jgi:Zn-dependent protease with chaperone function
MSNRILLFVTLFLIPVSALVVGVGTQARLEFEWRLRVYQTNSTLDQNRSDAIPLHWHCFASNRQASPICKWYNGVVLLEVLGLVGILIGLLLLSGIYFMSRLARGRRNRLVLFFKPGLYLTLLGLIGILLLNTAIFILTMSLGWIESVGAVATVGKLLIAVGGLGSIFGAVLLVRPVVMMLRKPQIVVIGRSISEVRCPRFWGYIRGLAGKVGALPPNNIVIGMNAGFFVVEAGVKCLSGALNGRTMYLSLPLCRILSENELRAAVGHELGHFKGDDTAFGRKFSPIYRGASAAIMALGDNMSGSIMSAGLLPAFSVISYFYNSFATVANEISRTRELAADTVSVEVAGALDSASSLVKEVAFAGYVESARDRMRESLSWGNETENLSNVFVELVRENSQPALLVGLDEECLSHPLDTHPPLKIRLDAFGVRMEAIEGATLATTPSDPAVNLIDDYEQFEKELTKAEQSIMEHYGEVIRYEQQICPACQQLSPIGTRACHCGFNFVRGLA